MFKTKKGDLLQRVMPPTPLGFVWRYRANVIFVDDELITCQVYADVPMVMKFHRDTGIALKGLEYGHLEELPQGCV